MKSLPACRRAAALAIPMVWFVLLAAAPTTATEESGADDSHRAVDLKDMPPNRPIEVELSVELVEVSQIQDHEEKFEVEFFLFMSWIDPRLAFDPDRTGSRKQIVPADEIWTPEPELIDDLDVNVQGGKHAHVQPDGTVLYRQYYRGTMSSDFDLHEFPFDRHRLELIVEATAGVFDDVRYVAGESGVRPVGEGESARVVPHGWNLRGLSSEATKNRYPRLNETYSRFMLSLDVERDPHYYWWSIVLPLLPIVVTSWSVFWMDPKEFSSQIGVGVTAMLTVVAYRITIDSSLPPLTYMTRMDYFLLVCQAFVFGSFLLSVAAHVCFALDTPEMAALARRINCRCRWVPPLAMTVTCSLLLLLPARMAMGVVCGLVGVALLACRPTPANMRRWWVAFLTP
ncbi:MAG TPA: hypothetical protein VGX78_21330, partial [Pirellulales bacterium]|nr:hypothetical protein [Pirellulales bacterium]